MYCQKQNTIRNTLVVVYVTNFKLMSYWLTISKIKLKTNIKTTPPIFYKVIGTRYISLSFGLFRLYTVRRNMFRTTVQQMSIALTASDNTSCSRVVSLWYRNKGKYYCANYLYQWQYSRSRFHLRCQAQQKSSNKSTWDNNIPLHKFCRLWRTNTPFTECRLYYIVRSCWSILCMH